MAQRSLKFISLLAGAVLLFGSAGLGPEVFHFYDSQNEGYAPVTLVPNSASPPAAVRVGSWVFINFPVTRNTRVLRLKLVANDINWPTLTQQVNEIRNWFYSQSSGRFVLNIDVTHTAYQNIPFAPVKSTEVPVGSEKQYQGVDSAWYDTNVTSLAKNYDFVLFLLPVSEWPNQAAAGWRTDRDQGPIEMQLRADERDLSYSQGYPVSAFVDFARHEITHGLFMLAGQEDITHQYYYGAKFDAVLAQVDFNLIPKGRR